MIPAYCDPNNEFKGSKYEQGLDIAVIAKRIRAEIKEAVEANRLPPGKYSVTIRRYSGGRSLDVRISDLPIVVASRPWCALQAANPHCWCRHDPFTQTSEAGMAIIKAVKAMVMAYNRDNSDSSTDYFDRNFYEDVSFDWEWKQRQEDAIKAQEKTSPSMAFEFNGNELKSWWDVKPAVQS